MADEVVVRSGRMFAVGGEKWEIRDSAKPVEFIDFVTEARHVNGVVYLSMASGAWDANNDPVMQIASRIRMNLGTAQFLHKLLGDMISEALKPVDQSKAN